MHKNEMQIRKRQNINGMNLYNIIIIIIIIIVVIIIATYK